MSKLSNIKLIKGVRLNKQQVNTLYFSNISAQESFFISKSEPTFDKNDVSYQRTNGVIDYDLHADDLKEFNYIMYQTERNNKWYYAFIDDVKYINDNASQILFTLDFIQTYLFDIDIKDCYIEREHTPTDDIGDNRVDENLNTGEYVNASSFEDDFTTMAYIISTTQDDNGVKVYGEEIQGVYSGSAMYVFFGANPAPQMQQFIKDINNDNAINIIYAVPVNLIDTGSISSGDKLTDSDIDAFGDLFFEQYPPAFQKHENYIPKNNKMFTHPYFFITCDSPNGTTKVYKYEDFETPNVAGRIEFFSVGSVHPDCGVILYPKYYKGLDSDINSGVQISNFPKVNWVSETFGNWLSQNSVSALTNISGASLGAAGLATAGVVAPPLAIAGAVIGVASSIGGVISAYQQPNIARGSTSGTLGIAANTQAFVFKRNTLTAENAKIIDNYFTKYGYKVNVVKTPNFNQRSEYTYVKTIENSLSGDLPQNAVDEWDKILKSGIRFWNNNDNVGDYSLSNNTY